MRRDFQCVWMVFWSIIFLNTGYGQQIIEPDAKIYRKSAALGLQLYTYGWGITFQKSLKANQSNDHLLCFELLSLKNKKEVRIPSIYRDQGGKSFIFDKVNYCYNFAASYGRQWTLLKRGNIKNIVWIAGLQAGLNLAILKPYFIEVINTNTSRIDVVPYDPARYTLPDIVGESDFFQGFDKLKVHPGLKLRLHTSLDFANEAFFVRALHTGVQVDYFFKPPSIMGNAKNPQWFPSLFLAFLIGNRF